MSNQAIQTVNVLTRKDFNTEIGRAAVSCKTAQEIKEASIELSKKFNRTPGSIVTTIYKFRRNAGLNNPRKRRSDAKKYTIKNDIVVAKSDKEKVATVPVVKEKTIFVDTRFTPSRVEVYKDHIRLFY